MSLEFIQRCGFERVGHWELGLYKSTKHLSHLHGVQFVLDDDFNGSGGVVYAFVIDKAVVYIGETTKGMRDRFLSYRYGNPLERDTDNRVKVELTDALLHGSAVTVWAVVPTARIELAAQLLEMSASKPVEEWLIAKLNPPLNRKRLIAN